ncbi:uL15 family ribosomal protein [Candidatus Woesearchaeota archaeon]|nr:uL15 family ribosomal protein [Candidatus Woesearchaeota archaeon]
MVVRRKKKSVRLRGETTHGFGSMKKNRGAGNRGGRGMAGSGKKADQKKPCIWKNKKYFGKYGFKKKGIKEDITPVNILFLEENLGALEAAGKISKENDVYVVDLEKIGYNKLLSKGKATKKFKITVPYASNGAVEKVKGAGGEVIVKTPASGE